MSKKRRLAESSKIGKTIRARWKITTTELSQVIISNPTMKSDVITLTGDNRVALAHTIALALNKRKGV